MQAKSLVNLMLRLENLENIKRFNQFPIINPRTVASHSFYVCWWSMLIALHEKGEKEIDFGKLLMKALLHDTEESMTGDILFPTKNEFHDGKIGKMLKEFAPKMMEEKILADLGDEQKAVIMGFWKMAKDDSIEGQIVKASDMVDCLIYSIKEIKTGNTNMKYIFNRAWKFLRTEKYSQFKFIIKLIEETEVYFKE